jgi:3-oxoacyl-[acyl-carrier protein] reductase
LDNTVVDETIALSAVKAINPEVPAMSDPVTAGPLDGRTALITGSGQNIGRAIALAFARDGANVVINGHRNQGAIDTVAAEARAFGVGAIAVLADVGDPSAVQAMVDRAAEAFGGVDIAVSNVSTRLHTKFLDISIEEWQRILNSNLNASFYLARAVLPLMQQRGWGRIIHISGVDGFRTIPNRAHNVTCKAGMFALSKAIALEFGPFGITANTVAPGVIDTTRDWTQYPHFRDGYGERIKEIPVRRIGRVDDIAEACTYLVGASFVTGQVLHVNGGDAVF